MARGDGLQLLEERYSEVANADGDVEGDEVGLDVGQLIQTLIALVTGCFVRDARRLRVMAFPARLAAGFRTQNGCSWATAWSAADRCCKILKEATDPEVESFLSDVKSR